MDSSAEPPEEEYFSILIATDNHLGYGEKDPIKGDDSFVAFEEILQHAVAQKVDLILLGGDLFHENKPSRHTIHKTMILLRKYCFGDKPISVEFLSNQKENFNTNSFENVNYEDPNLNVGIPVFSIHGNHDDPSGEGGLCALDLLSAAGLINYFGKVDCVDQISISPLLMQKGPTKLAIYGLGSIRDERLHRTFLSKKVKFHRPDQYRDDWFNIFVIHQNRVKHGPTSYIPEEFLPNFMNIVLWGHEHECIPELHFNETIGAYILQPGSSVATSLSAGETVPKHCFKLKIWKKHFCIQKLPLTTIRPLIYREVSLEGIEGDRDVNEFFVKHIDEMLVEAEEWKEEFPNAPQLPLLRLRYEYSGNNIPINSARFGRDYVGRVANAKDMLLNYKKKTYSFPKKDGKDSTDTLVVSEKGERTASELAVTIMAENKQCMNVLYEKSISIAAADYVVKLETDAVSEYIDYSLEQTKRYLKEKCSYGDDISEKLQVRRKMMTKNNEDDDVEEARKRWEKRRQEKEERGEASDDDELQILDDETTSKPARGRGSRGPRGSKAKAKTTTTATRGKGRGAAAKGDLDSFFSSSGKSQPSTSRTASTARTPRSQTQKGKKPMLNFASSSGDDSDDADNRFGKSVR